MVARLTRDRRAAEEPVEVVTAAGVLRGRRTDGVDEFLGIPYAAPPVGARRFAAPAATPPWTGARDATATPVRAVQPVPPVLRAARRVREGVRHGEDCLTVDVASPAGAAQDTAAGRPGRAVLVWVHGGAFRTGSGAEYDGAPLARLGDVLVVTVNYRLGALGFLDLTDALGLDAGDPRFAGNAGVLDVIAALEWVRDTIALFGGDPARVTIAGESAGAGIVTSLMVSSRARGLFAGVVAQSGALNFTTEREDAADAAREFLVALGAAPDRLDRLRDATPGQVLSAMRRVTALRPDGLPFRPWFDGDLLPASHTAARAASTAGVPLLIGTNRDEHRLFTVLRQDVVPRTRERIALMLVAEAGAARTAQVLDAYPDDSRGLNDLGTHGVFTMPAVHLADRHSAIAPVYRYRFDYGTTRLRLGAFHAIDLLFLFDGPAALDRVLLGRRSPERTALADRLRRHWVDFVRTGSPGGDWPRYEVPARATKLLDVTDSVAADPEGARRRVWHDAEVPAP